MSKVVLKLNFKPVLERERRAVSQLIRKVTFDTEADMKQRAPVDTGFLRNSIQSEFENDLTGVIGVGAEYAAHVEYGTSRAAAQPFFEPAMMRAEQGLETAAKDLLR
jgi:HK97 gp10 family phage protein